MQAFLGKFDFQHSTVIMRNKIIVLFLFTTVYVNAPAQLSTLYSVNGLTGQYLMSSLVSDGTYLYGTAAFGTMDYGSIFRIMPNGTGFSTIYSFTSSTVGEHPFGSLYFDGTYLYGMSADGGAGSAGIIFKLLPNGTGFTTLYAFSGTDGHEPYGALISDGTYLYGMTSRGGTYSDGVVFKIMPDGTGYAVIHNFDGSTGGEEPKGSLFYDGTTLYGTTNGGGSVDDGTVFKILPNGTGYTTLVDFTGAANGQHPVGSLIFDGTFLYGTTTHGGANNVGTLFKVMPNGSGFNTTITFAIGSNGQYPYGDLLNVGGVFYGLTGGGGNAGEGVLFSVNPNGTNYTKLFDFNSFPNGRDPFGSLTEVGGALFGTTAYGGAYDKGTIFRYNITTNVNESPTHNSIAINPNPSNGVFSISSSEPSGKVVVQNTYGQIVYSDEFNSNQFTLDLSSLTNGIYFIRLENDSATDLKCERIMISN
jgi:uncharacterized repeat protein (TIGR03803 family)